MAAEVAAEEPRQFWRWAADTSVAEAEVVTSALVVVEAVAANTLAEM